MAKVLCKVYLGEGKRPYKAVFIKDGEERRTQHFSNAAAAIKCAKNTVEHWAHYGHDAEFENAIWEPIEETNLVKGA